jgi:hypothetical protein
MSNHDALTKPLDRLAAAEPTFRETTFCDGLDWHQLTIYEALDASPAWVADHDRKLVAGNAQQ